MNNETTAAFPAGTLLEYVINDPARAVALLAHARDILEEIKKAAALSVPVRDILEEIKEDADTAKPDKCPKCGKDSHIVKTGLKCLNWTCGSCGHSWSVVEGNGHREPEQLPDGTWWVRPIDEDADLSEGATGIEEDEAYIPCLTFRWGGPGKDEAHVRQVCASCLHLAQNESCPTDTVCSAEVDADGNSPAIENDRGPCIHDPSRWEDCRVPEGMDCHICGNSYHDGDTYTTIVYSIESRDGDEVTVKESNVLRRYCDQCAPPVDDVLASLVVVEGEVGDGALKKGDGGKWR